MKGVGQLYSRRESLKQNENLLELLELTFFLPIIEGTDENDDEDSNSDSYTFYPIYLGKGADSGSFGTSGRRKSIWRCTEILVETESERYDGGD